MVSTSELFSTKNKYRVQEERIKSSKSLNNQIVIGVHRRVSTDRQAIEGDSLEMQSELAQKHTQKIGGVIFKYYTEEGLSAKKIPLKDRDVMQEIIQDIEDGKINYLIAYRRDRLFRNQAENMWFWSLLAEHDCSIYLTASGETQVKIEDLKKAGTTKMMESILAMMAEMESEITSTRVSDTMISMAQRGEYTGGSIPIGYTRDEEGNFIPKVGVEELVATIEDLYLQGYGMHSIARFLNGDEVKGLPQLEFPIPKPIEGDKSDIWNHRNINTILFSPFYTGHLSYESKKNIDMDRIITKVDYIHPIRTLEKQKQLNAFKSKKNEGMKSPRAYNTPFLLSGLIYCEECGEKLLTQTSKQKGKRFSYYRCANKSNNYKAKGCTNHGYRKEILESLIIKSSKDKIKLLLSDEYRDEFNKKIELDKLSYVNEYQKVEKEIKSKERELSNLTRMIIKIENESLQEQYIKEQEKLLVEINNLKESLSKIEEDSTNEEKIKFDYQEFYDLASQYGNIIEVAPVAVQKQMIESLFTNIYIDSKGEVTMQIRSGLGEIIDLSSLEETDAQDDVVIGFGTGRSAMMSKSINSIKKAISSFTISFNYFDYSKAIAEHFYTNLKQYVFTTNPKINPELELSINYDLLESINTNHFKDERKFKLHVISRYFSQVYNFSEHTFRKFYKSEPFLFVDVCKLLEFSDSNIYEYIEYLNDIDSELSIANLEALELILYIYSPKREGKRNEHVLFKDVAYCQCGAKSTRKINRTSPVTYYCTSKSKRNELIPCEFKATHEITLINTINRDTGKTVNTRSEVNDLINKIIIRDKLDFTIEYK